MSCVSKNNFPIYVQWRNEPRFRQTDLHSALSITDHSYFYVRSSGSCRAKAVSDLGFGGECKNGVFVRRTPTWFGDEASNVEWSPTKL
ncbi:hypothetical protein EUGRSUZ_I00117 [Eucalyptus grandis]|uniref:Uncharacterized protein n=2 Tax=Eucalyptus grandis TaxID=71139 RepID=A0ACC3JDW9_EUCGR|nr:hypothetical protein EUGRSUZ_I00117 [Eucalyptus grandis]